MFERLDQASTGRTLGEAFEASLERARALVIQVSVTHEYNIRASSEFCQVLSLFLLLLIRLTNKQTLFYSTLLLKFANTKKKFCFNITWLNLSKVWPISQQTDITIRCQVSYWNISNFFHHLESHETSESNLKRVVMATRYNLESFWRIEPMDVMCWGRLNLR